MAVHSVYSIGRESWTNDSRKVTRKIVFSLWADEQQINGNDTNRFLYKGITIDGKRAIMRDEVAQWIQELKSKALKAEIEENEKIVIKDPKNLKAMMLLGYDYYDDGQPEKAIGVYEKALGIATEASDKVEILNDIGFICRETKQYEKAVTALDQALKIDEKHLNALFNMGYVYAIDLNQTAKGVEYLTRYLAVDSTSPTAIQIKQDLESLNSFAAIANWIYVRNEGVIKIFLDVNNIKSTNGYKDAWIKTGYSDSYFNIQLHRFECNNYRRRVLESFAYYHSGEIQEHNKYDLKSVYSIGYDKSGNIKKSGTYYSTFGEWSEADFNNDIMFKKVCNGI